MQCNQPLFHAGFQNNAQSFPYYTQTHYPDVIGEGDVLSFILPDGTVQCYFVPINKRERWTPYSTNSYMPNNLPISSYSNNEAWFVRSILNPYPAAGLDSPLNGYVDPFTRNNVNTQNYGFVQKFHNDSCTSTTDLEYFFPRLRYERSKGCAALQVELPKEEKSIFHYGTICSRPCYCNKIEITKTTPNCVEGECTVTPMCVDEIKSIQNYDKTKRKEKNDTKYRNNSNTCPSSSRLETADKSVTTYADQAISCIDMKPSSSQTSKGKALERTDIEAEIWYPRRTKCKCLESEHVCDGVCSLSSTCSCID